MRCKNLNLVYNLQLRDKNPQWWDKKVTIVRYKLRIAKIKKMYARQTHNYELTIHKKTEKKNKKKSLNLKIVRYKIARIKKSKLWDINQNYLFL